MPISRRYMRTGSFVFSTVDGSGTVVSDPAAGPTFFVAFSGTSTTSMP